MKKLITLISISLILFSSCKTNKDIYLMDPKEIESSGFSTSGDSIYQNNKLIGEFTEVEWELYNGELIQEISVELDELNVNIESLIKYLHTIAPRAKIEVSGNKFK